MYPSMYDSYVLESLAKLSYVARTIKHRKISTLHIEYTFWGKHVLWVIDR